MSKIGKILGAAAILLAMLALARAQFAPMVPNSTAPMVPTGGTSSSPPGCTPDGKTDWSNACDIPMGVVLGVL
jgi:hypothetical protein